MWARKYGPPSLDPVYRLVRQGPLLTLPLMAPRTTLAHVANNPSAVPTTSTKSIFNAPSMSIVPVSCRDDSMGYVCSLTCGQESPLRERRRPLGHFDGGLGVEEP